MSSTFWQNIRSFSPDVVRYLGFQGATTFAYVGTISVLMNLYLLRLGYDTRFIGALTAAGMIVWGALALPASAVGARLGLKRTIQVALVSMAASSLLLVGAGLLPAGLRSAGLVAAWMLLWASAALSTVNILPYIMAITTGENRSYVLSIQQMLAAVVTLTGSVVAGSLPGLLARRLGFTLDHPAPYQLALLLAPLFYLAAAAIFSRSSEIAPVQHEAAHPSARQAPWAIFALLLLIVVLQSASDGAIRTFFNVYLDAQLGVPVVEIGAILGTAQLVPAVISLSIPSIIHRLGTRGAMLAGTGVSIGFILLLALVPSSGAATAALMGLAGLTAVIMTARSILSQEMVHPRWRHTTSALATMGVSVGWALSAWLGGGLVTVIGYRGLFLTGAGLALLAAGFTWLESLRARKESADLNAHVAAERP